MAQKDSYPPINPLPSLSRLMKDGIGDGYTREDHDQVQSQLFALYSKVIEVRSLSQIIGEDDLTEIDKIYMEFGREFEQNFLNQNFDESRTIEESLDIVWDLFKLFPKIELDRLESKYIEKYGRW